MPKGKRTHQTKCGLKESSDKVCGHPPRLRDEPEEPICGGSLAELEARLALIKPKEILNEATTAK